MQVVQIISKLFENFWIIWFFFLIIRWILKFNSIRFDSDDFRTPLFLYYLKDDMTKFWVNFNMRTNAIDRFLQNLLKNCSKIIPRLSLSLSSISGKFWDGLSTHIYWVNCHKTSYPENCNCCSHKHIFLINFLSKFLSSYQKFNTNVFLFFFFLKGKFLF